MLLNSLEQEETSEVGEDSPSASAVPNLQAPLQGGRVREV